MSFYHSTQTLNAEHTIQYSSYFASWLTYIIQTLSQVISSEHHMELIFSSCFTYMQALSQIASLTHNDSLGYIIMLLLKHRNIGKLAILHRNNFALPRKPC